MKILLALTVSVFLVSCTNLPREKQLVVMPTCDLVVFEEPTTRTIVVHNDYVELYEAYIDQLRQIIKDCNEQSKRCNEIHQRGL